MADQSHGVVIAGALITAAASIGGALIAIEPWKNDGGGGGTTPAATSGQAAPVLEFPDVDDIFRNASAFLSRDSGPGGTTVNVSGEGFSPEERVVIRFHTEQIASTQTNSAGSFSNVAVEIPTSFSNFAPQKFDIILSGESSIKSATAPFTITG